MASPLHSYILGTLFSVPRVRIATQSSLQAMAIVWLCLHRRSNEGERKKGKLASSDVIDCDNLMIRISYGVYVKAVEMNNDRFYVL